MKTKEFKERAIRHGEVVLIPIDRLPDNVETIESAKEIIVGHSESGHHHVAVCDDMDITAFRPLGADSQDLYLKVVTESRIEHRKSFDRHETKTLKPGLFKVYIKSGYDYFLKRSVKIVD